MGNEMMRWKSQADAAANAVSLAKDEVMERKRELDITKEKMDHLVEKLYIGREKGLELRGAIDFHLERHRTNYQSGRGGDKLPGIRRGGAPALAAAPSGGASKPSRRQGCLWHARGEDAPSRVHGWRKHVHPGARPQPPQRWRRGLRCEEGQALTRRTLAGVERIRGEGDGWMDGRMDDKKR